MRTLKVGLQLFSLLLLAVLAQLTGMIDATDRVQSFVLIYFAVSALFLALYRKGEPVDFFSPGVGLVLLLFLYSLSSALFVEATGFTAQNDPVNERTATVYYHCCLAGLVGLSFGMLAAQRVTLPRFSLAVQTRILLDNGLFYRKLLSVVTVLSVLFCAKIFPWFNFMKVESYAVRSTALRVERMDNAASGMAETFLVNLPIMLILCLAAYFVFARRNIVIKSMGILVLISYLARNMMAGWRGQVMSALVIAAVYYHYRVRRINTITAVLAGGGVYVLINVMSFVRSSSNVAEMYQMLATALQYGNLKFLSLTSSTELLVGTNLHRLIAGIGNAETSFSYGASILSELLVFIPKLFYPSRPLPLSEQFAATFYPGELEKGGGFGFFFLQEGYWALGEWGVLIFTFFYGWCTQKIYQWVRTHMQHDIVIFMYAAMYNVLVLSAVRTGMLGNFKNVLMVLIPFILVVMMPTLRLPVPFARNTAKAPAISPSSGDRVGS